MFAGAGEFICAISEAELDDARSRFTEVRELLGEAQPGTSISVGLAAMRRGDTLEALIDRAGEELSGTKRKG